MFETLLSIIGILGIVVGVFCFIGLIIYRERNFEEKIKEIKELIKEPKYRYITQAIERKNLNDYPKIFNLSWRERDKFEHTEEGEIFLKNEEIYYSNEGINDYIENSLPGWELVTVYPSGDYDLFVFRKREDSLNYNDHVKITKINTPEEFWARIKQKKSD